jgi:extracellular factor (EF) 3-hydroxypalmitic acid methyl ester biosynthesis protein
MLPTNRRFHAHGKFDFWMNSLFLGAKNGLIQAAAMSHSAANANETASQNISGAVSGGAESWVTFQTADGLETRGLLLRLSRHSAAFELLQPDVVLRASEVLHGFKIIIGGRTIFFGRGVVSGMVQTGTALIGEVKLAAPESESAFFLPTGKLSPTAQEAYDRFFQSWQKEYRIAPEFKVLVADIASYLTGVRQWLEQIEFSLKENKDPKQAEHEREMLATVAQRVIAAFNIQHERFEELAYQIPPELLDAHQDFVRRHWHKLFLGAPFGNRTFHKPLGYAGDYEMMNMIHRNAPEGRSLYEKLIHMLLVSQWPALSVRNRIAHLKKNLVTETARVARAKRRARILNVGCGPARELQDFFRETPLSHEVDCTLLDFNHETLDHASGELDGLRRQHGRRAQISTINMSVNQLLRRAVRQGDLGLDGHFDLIYCAGLFDYLSPNTCAELVQLFHGNLLPGGLTVVANMDDAKPFRNFIEFVLDWQLIYRKAREVGAFAPNHAKGQATVVAESAAVNLFLHLRKTE